MHTEESQQKEGKNVPVETEFSKKEKTKVIPYKDSYAKFRVELFKEVWTKGKGDSFRAFHILIQLGENKIVLSSDNLRNVLHQAGKHLVLLTEPTGKK